MTVEVVTDIPMSPSNFGKRPVFDGVLRFDPLINYVVIPPHHRIALEINSMRVNYENNSIEKPVGKRTPSQTIRFDELTRFIEIFKEVIDVRSPTEAVASWVGAGYDEQQVTDVLYSIIVKFGGGHRIWGRFHEEYENSAHDINLILSEAHMQRESDIDTLRAILARIPGLGGQSYSTKTLRFLNSKHVVMDSILRDEFCMKEADYSEFARQCRRIANILGVAPVDVESGLFTCVQLANPKQRKKYWKRYQCTGYCSRPGPCC